MAKPRKRTQHVADLKVGKRYIFRVLRPTVDGQPAVLLEPLTEDMNVHLEGGDEFITGTLASDPFKAAPMRLVKDDDPLEVDGNRRKAADE